MSIRGTRYDTSRRTATAAVLAALVLLSGCGQTSAPRGAVQGTVTVGGRPLERGRILFTSRNAQDGASVSAIVEQGRYRLPTDTGPVVGLNRIDLELDRSWAFSMDDEQAYAATGGTAATPSVRVLLPPMWEQTQIQAGENTLDMHLPAPSF